MYFHKFASQQCHIFAAAVKRPHDRNYVIEYNKNCTWILNMYQLYQNTVIISIPEMGLVQNSPTFKKKTKQNLYDLYTCDKTKNIS